MWNRTILLTIASALIAVPGIAQPQRRATAPKTLRLYILDCGNITGVSASAFGFKDNELATTEMVTPCYLIVHPRGTLMWDTGEIQDSAFKGDGQPAKQGSFTVTKPLLPQLAALGYTPADITYLGLSHYHGDHVANSNLFAGSTWLVQKIEHDAMFRPPPAGQKKGPGKPNVTLYSQLTNSKTTLIQSRDHDVFGDGTVVIKFSPGHTPGHQALFLKFAQTGPVVLSGDLYHYPEEMTLKRIPTFEFNKEQTAQSRATLEKVVKDSKAQLWIQHDATAGARLKKAPQYYE